MPCADKPLRSLILFSCEDKPLRNWRKCIRKKIWNSHLKVSLYLRLVILHELIFSTCVRWNLVWIRISTLFFLWIMLIIVCFQCLISMFLSLLWNYLTEIYFSSMFILIMFSIFFKKIISGLARLTRGPRWLGWVDHLEAHRNGGLARPAPPNVAENFLSCNPHQLYFLSYI